MDMCLPHLYRREAAVWPGRTADRALKEHLVATEQGHRRRDEPPRARHSARDQQGAPAGLGESRACACAVEEGRAAHEPRDSNKYVLRLPIRAARHTRGR